MKRKYSIFALLALCMAVILITAGLITSVSAADETETTAIETLPSGMTMEEYLESQKGKADVYTYINGEKVLVPPGMTAEQLVESYLDSVKETTAAIETTAPVESDAIPETTEEKKDGAIDNAIKSLSELFDSENVKNAFYSVCSILAAAVIVIMKGSISKAIAALQDKFRGFSNTTGLTTNNLVDAANKTADEIGELIEEMTKVKTSVAQNACNDAEHIKALDSTNAAVKALADMFYTTYQSSVTIPDAAKEVMREKYAALIKLTGTDTKEA